jgi:glycosyltransferase involved in cell wall biosynthesis
MWPSDSRPEHGAFVRDQVEALRRLPGVDVEVRHFPPGSRSYLGAAWKLRGSARRGRFDIVHAHYGLSGWSALASRGRLVVTFHGTDLRHTIVGPLSKLLARIVNLPATASRSLARESLARAGRRRSVAVLPCGVDLDRFVPIDRIEARGRLGLDPNRPYLLFPADSERPVKRYDRAAALAASFGEAKLVSLSGVAPNEVPLWINASNAVLVTSDREGFGLAAIESLACNVPVLSTPVGIAPLVLGDLPGALCEPFAEAVWVDALRTHLEHADPRLEGRSRAELFSSERMAKRLLPAYRELCGSPDHQRA